MIRPVSQSDAVQISKIYNHYVENTIVTFEERTVSPSEMSKRISRVTAALPWLVAAVEGSVCGYAYAAPHRTRPAYRFTAETTVYLSPDQIGHGLGTELYQGLLDELRGRGLHCALGGIALPNPASVALHEKVGFRKVGELKEVGWKKEKWIDVGYWELIL